MNYKMYNQNGGTKIYWFLNFNRKPHTSNRSFQNQQINSK